MIKKIKILYNNNNKIKFNNFSLKILLVKNYI